jgi:signal transduction histidine kinase/putative methionine-R-sulfoxide reductase with GAF domain
MPERRPPKLEPAEQDALVDELLARIADRSAKISFLQEMTGALARAESLGELLDRTAEIAQQHLPYDVCSTHLVDPESGRITVVLGSGPLFEQIETKTLKVGEGIVGWVVQHGLMASVPDVQKDPRYIASSNRIRSELAVPIRARGRTIGVFNLESSVPNAFTAYDEQIFSILAAQIGASMERVDLYREAVERARRLAALNQIARAIAAPLKLDRIFEVVADELARLIPNDRITLALHDTQSGEMHIIGVRGAVGTDAGPGARYKASGELNRGDRPTLHGLGDASPDIRGRLSALGIETFVAVPIRLEGEFVAQLNLAWRGPARLPEGGLDFLSALGSHLAVVLKNARLYEQLTESDAALVKTQDRLIQSAKLAAVGELAAGVAHELNNPLTGILGYTQWVNLEFGKKLQTGFTVDAMEPVRTRLQKIEREVLRCKEIVQNLLNFSRSQDRPVMEKLDVNAVVEATLGVTEHPVEMGRVKLVRVLTPGLPAIEGNANQLQQVFTNIVINACKAMPDGGTLTVETRAAAKTVEVAFHDSGIGMSKSVRERIFEPFFTTRKVGEGTGLGLSVSYGLVEAHGGEIAVESTEGKGSTFIVRLPAA